MLESIFLIILLAFHAKYFQFVLKNIIFHFHHNFSNLKIFSIKILDFNFIQLNHYDQKFKNNYIYYYHYYY
jgi:hypothetical protein